MMALTDNSREALDEAPRTFRTILLSVLLLAILLVAVAAAVGVITAIIHGTDKPATAAIVLLVALGAAGGASWGLFRLRPWAGGSGSVGPNTRRARRMFLLAGALGGVIGASLVLGTWGSMNPTDVLTDQPLPPLLAAIVVASWLIVMPVLSWFWFRSVDEHEVQSYNFGALIALHVYYVALPAWWMAWRGGFLPEPHHGTLFWVVTIVWCLGWFWRRYR